MKSTPEQRQHIHHPPCTVTDAAGSSYQADVLNSKILLVKTDKLELPIQVLLADGSAVTVVEVAGPVSHQEHTRGRKVFAVKLADAVEAEVGDDVAARRTPWICTVVPSFCR
jgi:hypothetical protein